MKKEVNHQKILNLIGAKKKVKALMMEVKQNKKKLTRKRVLLKQVLYTEILRSGKTLGHLETGVFPKRTFDIKGKVDRV